MASKRKSVLFCIAWQIDFQFRELMNKKILSKCFFVLVLTGGYLDPAFKGTFS